MALPLDDFLVYITIGALMCGIGLIIGYYLTIRYYAGRFMAVASECSQQDSLVPLITEMERES